MPSTDTVTKCDQTSPFSLFCHLWPYTKVIKLCGFNRAIASNPMPSTKILARRLYANICSFEAEKRAMARAEWLARIR